LNILSLAGGSGHEDSEAESVDVDNVPEVPPEPKQNAPSKSDLFCLKSDLQVLRFDPIP
jgi:hypothetical protein